MNLFDNLAQGWDTPDKVARAHEAAQKLLDLVPQIKNSQALEFGGGTALLSQALQQHLKKITVLDSSTEMVKEINQKIKALNYSNMSAQQADIVGYNEGVEQFDLVYSLLTLHHIADISKAFESIRAIQPKGGFLVTFDLYPEDGSFHNHMDGVHLGFSSEQMAIFLNNAGYEQRFYEKAFTIQKSAVENEQKEFPVFISVGQKQ